MEEEIGNPIVKICAVLLVIQTLRILLSQALLRYVENTISMIDIVSMLTMIVLTVGILIFAGNFGISFSFRPECKTKAQKAAYIIISAVVLLLIASSLIISRDLSAGTIIPLVYSVLVTPVFEELIFRGYIWNELLRYGNSQLRTYVITAVLFSLWHLGYADVIWMKLSLQGGGNLLFIMLMKAAVGLFFGIVVGFVRFKTKNTYAAMLMHSVMNLFGR